MHPAILLLALGAARPEEVVARVGSDVVTARMLRDRIEATRRQGGNTRPEDVVEDLVNEALFAREGERLGLDRDPGVLAQVEAERRRLAAGLLVDRDLAAAARVDDAVLLRMFHDRADTAHLRVAVFATRDEAGRALERLRGGGSWADAAGASLDPGSAARGGDQGTRSRGDLDPAIAEVAFSAPPRALQGPVALDLGYAAVQVLDRSIGSEEAFRDERDGLRRFAEGQARIEARRHYLAQLRKRAGVTLDDEFLRSTGARLEATPDEAAHVLASVNGRPLRYGDVLPAVRRLARGKEGGHFSGPVVKSEIAWSEIDDRLLEDAAMARGYGEAPEVVAALGAARRDAVVRALAARIRREVPAPGPADVERYWRDHAADFRLPGRRACSQLVAGNRDTAARLRERIVAGEPFEAVARSYSQDEASRGSGGAMGEISDDGLDALAKGGEPELAAAFRSTPPGEVSRPARSRVGWHLVRCGPHAPPATAPLDSVRERIAAAVRAERERDAVVRRIAELRAAADVAVDRAAVARAAAQPS